MVSVEVLLRLTPKTILYPDVQKKALLNVLSVMTDLTLTLSVNFGTSTLIPIHQHLHTLGVFLTFVGV